MGKRSDFERVERDFYPTPGEAVFPLLHHLEAGTHFDEPCAGDGALITHLERHGHICGRATDIAPRADGIRQVDVFARRGCYGQVFITNPPWDRKILHPLIAHLSSIAPTWLLFDADWMHTRQSVNFMSYCHKIVSAGRVKWIPGTAMTGKDNAAWYLFDRGSSREAAQFFGRVA